VCWNAAGDTAASWSGALDKYTSKFRVSLQSTQFQIICQEKNLKSKPAAHILSGDIIRKFNTAQLQL